MPRVPIDNHCPFSGELFCFPDSQGQEILLLVLMATFEEREGKVLQPLHPPIPIRVADEHFGNPALSSVRYEADVALQKRFVDVIVNGSAHAPYGKRCRSITVELHVGDIHKKLKVTGDRKGKWGLLSFSRPVPFSEMPIVYERAYGGSDFRSSNPKNHKVCLWNPVGVGYKGVISNDPTVITRIPNIGHTSFRSWQARKDPPGFGIIGRGWKNRLKFAGTYDEKWLETQWPLLPLDFDCRHYQCAPTDQQSRTIQGGEEVCLTNVTPDGIWKFQLPKLNVPIWFLYEDRQVECMSKLDTVLIEPDHRRVLLSSRIAVPVERNRPPLREVVLGHMAKGWLRAKATGKRYWEPNRQGGIIPNKPYFL